MYAMPALEGLMTLDAEGNLQPCLATSWEITEDGSRVIFHLRQGVKFHDGTDFNAETAKYNMDIRINNKNLPHFDAVSEAEIIDLYTIYFHVTEKFDWQVMQALATSFNGMEFSPTAIEKNGQEWARYNPVGTGPFTFAAYQADLQLRYVRFDDYWGDGPYLDGIGYLIVSDATVRSELLKTGEVHATNALPEDASELYMLGFNILESEAWVTNHALVPDSNSPDSPFADIRVREALEYAIDKEALANAIGYGYAEPSYQPFTSKVEYYAPDLTVRSYNPQYAKQLLADAGYPYGFETQLIVPSFVSTDMTTIIRQYLAEIGVNCEINIMDSVAFINSVFNNGWQGLAYGYCPSGYMFDPAGTLLSGPLGNNMYIANEEPEELLYLADMAASSLGNRTALYREITVSMIEDYAMWCFLYSLPELYAMHPEVKNFDPYLPSSYAETWLED
jgi:peptide/nickel transport system substrate-binding protein